MKLDIYFAEANLLDIKKYFLTQMRFRAPYIVSTLWSPVGRKGVEIFSSLSPERTGNLKTSWKYTIMHPAGVAIGTNEYVPLRSHPTRYGAERIYPVQKRALKIEHWKRKGGKLSAPIIRRSVKVGYYIPKKYVISHPYYVGQTVGTFWEEAIGQIIHYFHSIHGLAQTRMLRYFEGHMRRRARGRMRPRGTWR
jgi:hypothetical protein